MSEKVPKRTRVKKAAKAPPKKVAPAVRRFTAPAGAGRFEEVLGLIEAARQRAYQAVNTELIALYWRLGEYISQKIESAQWGDGVVDELAAAIAHKYPGMRGYTRSNLFRMRQFYETYRASKKVAPTVRQLPWTHHLLILGRAKHQEEREFDIRGRRVCPRAHHLSDPHR
ncbi:MAG TPA: DUF1016 N-terminal domain-containing protein [Verrucomicrobiales bacterium]|nr:DUF1016 N-terminal domain-containing protein [Verrucomicrobiales bacterium]